MVALDTRLAAGPAAAGGKPDTAVLAADLQSCRAAVAVAGAYPVEACSVALAVRRLAALRVNRRQTRHRRH